MSTVPLAQIPVPHDTATLTLVDQLVQWARRRIDERVFRPGMRMPSIRKLALDKSVSRFTVVEAYERLVAQGYLDSRRGSGFYVRERTAAAAGRRRRTRGRGRAGAQHDRRRLAAAQHAAYRQPGKGPGLGYLPGRWLDGELITGALRALGRQSGAQMLGFGTAQGFLPLRQQRRRASPKWRSARSPNRSCWCRGSRRRST